MSEPSCEGEVVARIGKPQKNKISVMDGKSTVIADGKDFEKWVAHEVVEMGHKSLNRKAVEETWLAVRNKAKRVFGEDTVRKSTQRVASDTLKWCQNNSYDPYTEQKTEFASTGVSYDDRGNWPGKKPTMPPKGYGGGSSVPDKWRNKDERVAAVEVEVDDDEEIQEMEDAKPTGSEVDLAAMIEKAADKMVAEAVVDPIKSVEPWPTRPLRVLCLKGRSVAKEVAAVVFENCKILDCEHIYLAPIGSNRLTACCEEQDSEKCPQKSPLKGAEKEVYDTVIGSIGEAAAKKTVFKIRALAKRKMQGKVNGQIVDSESSK